MGDSPHHVAPIGHFPDPKCPGELELVTGWLPNGYRRITPDDGPLYDDFLEVRRLQQTWDRATHFTFWLHGLKTWPLASRQVAQTDALALRVWGWRRFGSDDQAIAERLGRARDSLRRRGVLKAAVDLDAPADLWVRAPVVVAIEHDRRPSQMETWYDPRLSARDPHVGARSIREQLASLSSSSPR